MTAKARRVAEERLRFGLKPWELAPSEVDDGPSPYVLGSAGYDAWQQAQVWRAELRAADPDYFEE